MDIAPTGGAGDLPTIACTPFPWHLFAVAASGVLRSIRLSVPAVTLLAGCGARTGVLDEGSSVAPPVAGDAAPPDSAADAGVVADIVLFGGSTISGDVADTWRWDGATWTQLTGPGPGARSFSSAAALTGTVVLFGGIDHSSVLGDTWAWAPSAWKRLGAAGPTPRMDATLASFGGTKVLLFGGSGNGGDLGDTWEWDGAAWAQVATSGPPARSGAAASALGDKLVLFGGLAGTTFLGDTWEWDGTGWSQVSVTGPVARSDPGMATLKDRVLLFGGAGDGGRSLADTWGRSDPCRGPARATIRARPHEGTASCCTAALNRRRTYPLATRGSGTEPRGRRDRWPAPPRGTARR
jgi:hypothetical protein